MLELLDLLLPWLTVHIINGDKDNDFIGLF